MEYTEDYDTNITANENEEIHQDNPALSQPVPPNTETPNHSFRIRFKSRHIIIRVRLPLVPDKFVNLWPTNTEFYLDTFKYTKKYLLRFPYPRQIQVNADEAQVEFVGEYLTVTLPILQIRDDFNNKILRKKGYKPEGKSKEKSDSKKKKKKQKTTADDGSIDKKAMLSLVESINDAEDQKLEAKLQKEKERVNFIQQRIQEKQERKRKRQELRSKSLEELKSSMKREKKSSKRKNK